MPCSMLTSFPFSKCISSSSSVNYLLPGMILGWDCPSFFEPDVTTSIMDPKEKADLLASKELLGIS